MKRLLVVLILLIVAFQAFGQDTFDETSIFTASQSDDHG